MNGRMLRWSPSSVENPDVHADRPVFTVSKGPEYESQPRLWSSSEHRRKHYVRHLYCTCVCTQPVAIGDLLRLASRFPSIGGRLREAFSLHFAHVRADFAAVTAPSSARRLEIKARRVHRCVLRWIQQRT